MAGFKQIMTALLVSMTGWIFAYFTYPFFNAMLTAVTETTGIFEGWSTINNLLWLGYFGIVVMWCIVLPAYAMFTPNTASE